VRHREQENRKYLRGSRAPNPAFSIERAGCGAVAAAIKVAQSIAWCVVLLFGQARRSYPAGALIG
jgi:hypothetical protein